MQIPFVGTVADVRDLLASDSVGDVLINLVGFIPLVGSLKYSDEVYTVVKHTDDVDRMLFMDDVLYGVSEVSVSAHDINSVELLNQVEL